jgi:hypothetical protein
MKGLVPVAPPASLRARVLAAAGAAAREGAGRGHWIDRAWESAFVRWGWAVVLLLTLFGQVAVDRAAQRAELANRRVFGPPPAARVLPAVDAALAAADGEPR